MDYIKIGIEKSYIKLLNNNKQILYISQNKKYKFTDPEEKVRASFFVELIERYQYPCDKIDIEVKVPRRTPNDLADIVVFKDSSHLIPYIVIECKRDDISDSEFNQGIEQSFGNANSLRSEYTGIVSGITRRYYDVQNFSARERSRNIIADIPIHYGKVQEFRYIKGHPNWDLQSISKSELINILSKCNDTLWDGGKMDPIDAFDELSKIIFVKVRDEKLRRRQGEPYDFQIKTHETPDSVHKRLLKLYESAKEIDPEVFSDKIKSDANKLFTVVNHLQGISLSDTDLDVKGIAFESFMEDFFKGKQGQYFTPREIVRFIVDLCGLNNETRILDPACGSGGFLLHAMDFIRESADQYYVPGTAEHDRHWHYFAKDYLYGIEVSERIARVAKMNMILHDDGHSHVICCDALKSHKEIQHIKQDFKENYFDLILTNPPFGSNVKKSEKAYVSDFILGHKKDGKQRDSQKSEILFIERCYQYLKPGTGRIALILPDGILTNKTQYYVRDFIIKHFEVQAIISLPQVTFMHYGAGLKSSILLLRKLGTNEKPPQNDVFCAIANKVGYDATGRIDKSDLPNILCFYNRFIAGEKFADDNIYIRNINELNQNRLDAYYYSPLFDRLINSVYSSRHPVLPLSTICYSGDARSNYAISNGSTPAKKDYSENVYDPKIVKVASLKNASVNFDLVEYVKPDKTSTKVIADGDILILSSAHQAEYLGRNPCIVSIPDALKSESIQFVGELINIRVNQEIINPYFLLQLLKTKKYFLLINREKRGQTSHLYPDDLAKLPIPVPKDMDLQNENAANYLKNYTKYQNLIRKAEDLLEHSVNDFEDTFFMA